MNRNDIDEIVIATDAGREGELVARWIIEKSQVKTYKTSLDFFKYRQSNKRRICKIKKWKRI